MCEAGVVVNFPLQYQCMWIF